MSHEQLSRRVQLSGVGIDALTLEQAVGRAVRLAKEATRPRLVVTPNVDHLIRVTRDGSLRELYNRADLVLADGQPVVWLSRLARQPLPERISGVDFFYRLLGAAVAHNLSLYLLGSTAAVSQQAIDKMRDRYPGIKIVGSYSGAVPGKPEAPEAGPVLAELRAAKPDVVGVFLGSPKQEQWYAHFRDQLPPGLYMGLGGTLDFVSGRRRRSPRVLQRLGGEWLWRLALDPRRLWRRYGGNIRHGGLLVRQALSHRTSKK